MTTPLISEATQQPMPDLRHPVIHGSFTHTRTFAATPARIFAVFSQLELRRQWFRIPGHSHGHELDFRVGGHEATSSTFAPSGVDELVAYRSQFLDIVANERMVFSTEVVLNGRRRSVALVTIELWPEGNETRLSYSEQYAILLPTGDGQADMGEKKGGTWLLLNRLQFFLESSESAGQA